MEFESFDEGTLLYIGIPEGETAPVDSLLAIIGDEGEDVTALIAAKSEPKIESESAKPENKSSNYTRATKKKNNIYSACSFTRGSRYCHHASTERHNDRRNSSHLVKQSGDKIKEGDILAEIETDKATMEFESFNEGTLYTSVFKKEHLLTAYLLS
jgi:pyruvate dehydrogenase E2 component (dihydrolipoamide acetyltransferase)